MSDAAGAGGADATRAPPCFHSPAQSAFPTARRKTATCAWELVMAASAKWHCETSQDTALPGQGRQHDPGPRCRRRCCSDFVIQRASSRKLRWLEEQEGPEEGNSGLFKSSSRQN